MRPRPGPELNVGTGRGVSAWLKQQPQVGGEAPESFCGLSFLVPESSIWGSLRRGAGPSLARLASFPGA